MTVATGEWTCKCGTSNAARVERCGHCARRRRGKSRIRPYLIGLGVFVAAIVILTAAGVLNFQGY